MRGVQYMKISTKLILTFTLIIAMIVSILIISNSTNTNLNDDGSEINNCVSLASDSSEINKRIHDFEQNLSSLMLSFFKVSYISDKETLNKFEEEEKSDFLNLTAYASEINLPASIKTNLINVGIIFDDLIKIKNRQINANKFINGYKEITLPKKTAAKIKIESQIENLVTFDIQKVNENIEYINSSISDDKKISSLKTLSLLELERILLDDTYSDEKDKIDSLTMHTRNLILEIEMNNENVISDIKEYFSSEYTGDSNLKLIISVYDEKINELKSYNDSLNIVLNEIEKANKNIANTEKTILKLKNDEISLIKEHIFPEINNIYDETTVISGNEYKNLEDSFKLVHDSTEKMLDTLDFSNFIIILIIILVILLVIFFSFVIVRSIQKRIRSLILKIEILEKLDFTVNLETGKKDEIGKIEESLHKVSESIINFLKQVKNSSEVINKSSENNLNLSNETFEKSEILGKETDVVENNVLSVYSAITELNDSIQNISSSAQNIANISQELSEKTLASETEANTGENTVIEISSITETAVNKIESTSKYVSDLHEYTKNIGNIVSSISSISEQTNLLALNAAIEAARAGEVGKGFAVVADEIRKLAEESQEATKNIATILKKIQNGVAKTSVSTEETSNSIIQLNLKMEEVTSQFKNITENTIQISALTQDLAGSAQEQSASTEEMASGMEYSSRSIEEIKGKIIEINGLVEKQKNSSSEVSNSSEMLLQTSTSLEDEIRKFKV